MSYFLNPILLSAIVSFSILAHADLKTEICDQSLFDLSNVSPGETRTLAFQTVYEPLVTQRIEEIKNKAAIEFGTQKSCTENSDHCFGHSDSTRYSISRLRDPFHPVIASSGQKILSTAQSDQDTPYPYGVYEITNCEWNFPGQVHSCTITCALIAEPSPGS